MRNRTVTLLDLGLDSDFAVSTAYTQQLLQSLAVGDEQRALDVITVRSREAWTIHEILTRPSDVLHVMAHAGKWDDGELHLGSEDADLAALAEVRDGFLQKGGYPISAGIVIADACNTAAPGWVSVIRDVLGQETAYIATKREVYWRDSTVFTANFYAALTRTRGKSTSLVDQAIDATHRANTAFREVTGHASPYVCKPLRPSRPAKNSLREDPL